MALNNFVRELQELLPESDYQLTFYAEIAQTIFIKKARVVGGV